MSIVNVILPDGSTYQTAEAIPSQTTTIINTVEERHEVTHITDELVVSNVLVADYDEAYDEADSSLPDPLARSQQKFNEMPNLRYGNKFSYSAGYKDHNDDTDPTTDSSAIKMYRNIYIEPPPNKGAGFPAPTLFTAGSICVCGEGAIGYIPYSVSGQQIPNTKYLLGRQETIGDRSHDNDGLLMTLQKAVAEETTRIHKIHISPEPTDPAILIESNRTGHFLKFVNRGPGQPVNETENTMFSIDSTGTIFSLQIINIRDAANAALTEVQQLAPVVEEHSNSLSDLFAHFYDVEGRVTQLEEQLRHGTINP